MGKAEKTKQFIIEKTAPIFNSRGFWGTSLQDLTSATGLTKGSIYGNFKNKDEVALAVLEHNLNKVSSLVIRAIAEKKSYRDKLLCYPDLYEDFAKHDFPAGGCPILNTAIEADDTHPALKETAKKALLYWKDSLTYLINKGKEKGEFKPETDAEENALAIIALIEGSRMMIKLTGKLNHNRSIMQTLRKLIVEL
ncbi:MAG: TetR/AcrR family transcriptional regulator [Flavobacterium sp.]|jgi:hypothetical protein|nr:TetR/AcrR family transcriptional regulator [Flavobacterium sp.]